MFKNPLITIFILLSATIVFAQPDDGLNDREISTYSNNVETARNTIIFKSGFNTIKNIETGEVYDDLHAYIDEFIPQGGYKPGITNMNYIRVFTPIYDNEGGLVQFNSGLIFIKKINFIPLQSYLNFM